MHEISTTPCVCVRRKQLHIDKSCKHVVSQSNIMSGGVAFVKFREASKTYVMELPPAHTFILLAERPNSYYEQFVLIHLSIERVGLRPNRIHTVALPARTTHTLRKERSDNWIIYPRESILSWDWWQSSSSWHAYLPKHYVTTFKTYNAPFGDKSQMSHTFQGGYPLQISLWTK